LNLILIYIRHDEYLFQAQSIYPAAQGQSISFAVPLMVFNFLNPFGVQYFSRYSGSIRDQKSFISNPADFANWLVSKLSVGNGEKVMARPRARKVKKENVSA
jgi:hypothetical protein